jgi:hypothetical protein
VACTAFSALVGCSAPAADAASTDGTSTSTRIESSAEASVKSPAIVAGRDRWPASVPPEYHRTPNGYFHPACVHEVPSGGSIDERGNIVEASGQVRYIPECVYPRFDRTGAEIPKEALRLPPRGRVPGINGWLAWFAADVSNPTWVSSSWVVPAAPYRQGGQTIYFFNGLEPGDGSQIVQPVLQWNQSGSDHSWAVSAWNVSNSNAYNSTPVRVNPGDKIDGYRVSLGQLVVHRDQRERRLRDRAPSPNGWRRVQLGYGRRDGSLRRELVRRAP